jgi:hypothetical protein
MPLTPDPPFPKTQGDNIRSKDWNDAVNEIIRLDNAKANRGGDRFTGPLTIDGSVGIGTPTPSRRLHVEPTEIHSGGNGGGFSFANRQTAAFVENPAAGERWVWYASGGVSRLWSGGDKLTVAQNGDLNIAGRLTAPNFFAGAAFRIGAGRTPPGSTAWQVYGTNGIFVDVSTAAAQFSSTPIYVTALHGISSHWATTGGTSVYSPSPTGFRIYVKWSDSNALTPQTANSNQWHIQWIGIQI